MTDKLVQVGTRKKGQTQETKASKATPMADIDNRRYIFLSASFLSKQYKSIPAEIIDNAIFFFGSKRSWLFPKNREEMIEARNQQAKYLEFDEDFKSLILSKEGTKSVYWMLPEKSFKAFSHFLESIYDPITKENYLPLILDISWWETGICFIFFYLFVLFYISPFLS